MSLNIHRTNGTPSRKVAFIEWWRQLDVSKLAFRLSAVVGLFLLGGVFATLELQPYQVFENGFKAARLFYSEQTQTKPLLVQPLIHEGDGVTVHDAVATFRGLTAMQGLFPEGVELRLVDMAGTVVHRWHADFHAIWPDPSHVFPRTNVPIDALHYHTQGMWLLPDGSVVFNFSMLGTVKLDKCGAVVWKVDRLTHHSITPNFDGSFWIPAKADVRDVPQDLMLQGVSAASLRKSDARYEDRLLLVGADGKVLRELSALRAVFDAGLATELYDMSHSSRGDPTHVNDIEVVTPALAARIDGVEAGDLLISIRQMHMLAILDEQTGALKWRRAGPWIRQHDPDITAQGLIEVFNNGDRHLAVDGVRGSSVISLDPATGGTETVHPRDPSGHFFSDLMGTHQLLPNGNRLITESQAGRIFEIDAEGKIVWEFVEPYDDSDAVLIEKAYRYGDAYFEVRDWSCPESAGRRR
ncbi:MAG TPA: arylsulfotransferase family protein, partial [Steroidobacteraceae bacterium]